MNHSFLFISGWKFIGETIIKKKLVVKEMIVAFDDLEIFFPIVYPLEINMLHTDEKMFVSNSFTRRPIRDQLIKKSTKKRQLANF